MTEGGADRDPVPGLRRAPLRDRAPGLRRAPLRDRAPGLRRAPLRDRSPGLRRARAPGARLPGRPGVTVAPSLADVTGIPAAPSGRTCTSPSTASTTTRATWRTS